MIRRYSLRNVFLVGLITIAYIAAYLVLYPLVGINMGTIAVLPMLGAAWLIGVRAGIVMWFLTFPLQSILLQWVGRDGVDSWFQLSWLPGMGVAIVVTVVAGRLHTLSLTLQNELAERKKTEIALRHSEQFARRITEASTDIVYVYDMNEGRFVYSSRSLAVTLGYTDKELADGDHAFLKRMMHPKDFPMMLKKPDQYRAAKDGEVITEEYRLWHVSGEWRWFYNRETIFTRNPDGSPCQVVGTSHDITERKRAADVLIEKERLQLALQKEKELTQLKARFMTVISHEFRTPLAIIQSSGELLDRYFDRLSQTRREECISTIRTQIQYVSDMLNDMSLVAAGEDHLEYKPVPTDVAAFCKRLAEEISQAKEHPVLCTTSGALNHIPVDVKLLHHVLNNLLSNAIKYSPDGAPVHLDVGQQGDSVTFAVRDHGIGIPADDQDRIFETFYRAKNVGNIVGTGLGLRIARDYVELQGGTITMDSRPGEGSCFTVRLPVVEIEKAAVEVAAV